MAIHAEMREDKMAKEAQKTYRVTAKCGSNMEAISLAEIFGKYPVVSAVTVVGKTIYIFYRVVERMALSTFGKIKDCLPSRCQTGCSCAPYNA